MNSPTTLGPSFAGSVSDEAIRAFAPLSAGLLRSARNDGNAGRGQQEKKKPRGEDPRGQEILCTRR